MRRMFAGLTSAVAMVGGGLVAAPAARATTYTPAASAASLGDAIAKANAHAGADTIDLRGLPNGAAITVTDPQSIPTITDPLTIEAANADGTPRVKLTGPNDGTPAPGLRFAAGSDGSTVRGLDVARFNEGGIVVEADDVTVSGAYVGVDLDGGTSSNGVGNGLGGIVVTGSHAVIADSTIGDNHDRCGVSVMAGSGTQVVGNRIGTDVTGTKGVGNSDTCGVRVGGSATATTIGGTSASDRNVISGNGTAGVEVVGGSGTVIRGDYVGLGANGADVISNAGAGISVTGGTSTTIDGVVASGNLNGGIALAAPATVTASTIGLAADRATVASNDGFGVRVLAGGTIGGAASTAANVISGNGGPGVLVAGSGSPRVVGNVVGLTASGLAAASNADGIVVTGSGGVISGNLVSGNYVSSSSTAGRGLGIDLTSGAGDVSVYANQVGGTADGGRSVGNSSTDVLVEGGAHDVRIGNATSDTANRIVEVNSGTGAIRIKATGQAISARGNTLVLNGSPTGIDRGATGIDDAGAPRLASVLTAGGRSQLRGNLTAAPSTTYAVDFYTDAACSSTGHRGADGYLGSTSVTTDGSGVASFNTPVDTAVSANTRVLATATSGAGGTSELGPCSSQAGPAPSLQLSATSYRVSEAAGTVRIPITRTNGGDGSASVRLRTSDASATAGRDYTATDVPVLVNAGQDGFYDIPIANDGVRAGDRSFVVTISDPDAAVLGAPRTATVTLVDDGPLTKTPAPPADQSPTASAPVASAPATGAPAATPTPGAPSTAPLKVPTVVSKLKVHLRTPSAKRQRSSSLKAIRGTVTGGTPAKVQVAVTRRGACRRLSDDGTLHASKAKGCPPLWRTASGKRSWQLALTPRLPTGPYLIRVRAIDSRGRSSLIVRKTIKLVF